MTLLFIYTSFIIVIETCVFKTGEFFQLIKMSLRHKSKNSSKNQTNFSFMVVEKLSYLHLMNFFHIHQLIWMSSSINFFSVSKKITRRAMFLMMMKYFAVCLLVYLLQN